MQFLTGHGTEGRLPEDIDWAAIADPVATTVVYMPRKTLSQFAERALAAGIDPQTPAMAIASATLPQQNECWGTIADIARRTEALRTGAPVTVIIGRVARPAPVLPSQVNLAA